MAYITLKIANTVQEMMIIDSGFKGNITQFKAFIWIEYVFGESGEERRKRPIPAHAVTVLKKEKNGRQFRQIAAFCCYVPLINQHQLQKQNDTNRL